MTTAPEVPAGHGYLGPAIPRTAQDDPQRAAFIDSIHLARHPVDACARLALEEEQQRIRKTTA